MGRPSLARFPCAASAELIRSTVSSSGASASTWTRRARPTLGGDAAQLRAQDEVNAVQGEEAVARVREPFARLLDPQRMCEVAGGQQVDALDAGPVRQAVERQAPARAAGERRMDVKVGGVGHAAILSDAASESAGERIDAGKRQTKRRTTWDDRVFFLTSPQHNPFTPSSAAASAARIEGRTRLSANARVGPTQRLSCAGPSIHPDEASGDSGRTGCVGTAPLLPGFR